MIVAVGVVPRQMIVLEFKAKGKTTQYKSVDEAIRTAQFVRNKCIRFWMDNRGVGQKELYRHNTKLRAEFPFVNALNSHACQVAEPNPKFYRTGEKRLKFRQRRVSRKNIGSTNRKKAINKLGRVHLKISRQREEHACRLARCVIQSNDLVAYVSEAGRVSAQT